VGLWGGSNLLGDGGLAARVVGVRSSLGIRVVKELVGIVADECTFVNIYFWPPGCLFGHVRAGRVPLGFSDESNSGQVGSGALGYLGRIDSMPTVHFSCELNAMLSAKIAGHVDTPAYCPRAEKQAQLVVKDGESWPNNHVIVNGP
jgi:hypothetical protein